MEERYAYYVTGSDDGIEREIPVWVLTDIDKSNNMQLLRRACWYKVCDYNRDRKKHPEEWLEKIKNPVFKTKWHRTDSAYFRKYMSEYLFNLKTKGKYPLDEKAEGIFSDYTNREIVIALYNYAFDVLHNLTREELLEYIKNY